MKDGTMGAMTRDDIEAVLERVRTWPPARQEDAARLLLEMEAQGTTVYQLSKDERAAIEESREQTRRGQFATDEEVAALFERYRK
jgi:phage terminase large subunit-like protein